MQSKSTSFNRHISVSELLSDISAIQFNSFPPCPLFPWKCRCICDLGGPNQLHCCQAISCYRLIPKVNEFNPDFEAHNSWKPATNVKVIKTYPLAI